MTGGDADGLRAAASFASFHLEYSPADGEIHVVYRAEQVNNAEEAFITIINANDYSFVTTDIPLTDLGNNPADGNFDVWTAAIAFNSTEEHFLIVVEGDDDDNGSSGEHEVYGQIWQGAATNPPSLPVELVSFTAQRTDKMLVQLDWSTAVESNSSHYDVERMFEGETVFEKVAEIKSNGNTMQTSYYGFEDVNGFPETSYYRLKMVDADGSFEYSNIISVNGIRDGGDLVDVYPNPIDDVLNVHLEMEAESIKLQIVHVNGAVVLEKEIDVPSNRVITINDLGEIPMGIYILRLFEDDIEQVSQKFYKF